MPSDNIKYLKENGPSPISELPHNKIYVEDRVAGVWKFKVSGKTAGGVGTIYSVYYLQEHDPEEVVRAWVEANEEVIESNSLQTLVKILNRQGSEFQDAISIVIREYKK